MSKTIDIADILWNDQRTNPAPLNVPVITLSPMRTVQIHIGRNLLDWTRWLTLEEFYTKAKETIENTKDF